MIFFFSLPLVNYLILTGPGKIVRSALLPPAALVLGFLRFRKSFMTLVIGVAD
jgi:hypothetical protein